MANTFLLADGFSVGASLAEPDLVDEARSLAREIARNDRLAVRLTKQALNRACEIPRMREALEHALEIDVEIESTAGTSAEIVEFHTSLGDADQYANTVLKLKVGNDAALAHIRIQDRSLAHLQTGRTTVSVGRGARFESASFDLGGGMVRNDLDIDIAQPGAEVSFDGLYLAGDGQHIDNHTRVDHRVGPATSRQEYRGILNGNCRCVWNGKAIVHKGADGTDARQANHNLLLSEKAEIDAKPELEIYADDVKCSHGTTVGQLDETALFYLRSRGLGRNQATRVLTHAFAAGLVQRAPVAAATDTITELVETRLGELIETDFITEALS